ncbi:MAG: hypothetical protein Q7S00_02020 [bacterium]|nr:hypothetical protein [bacterium]
MAPPFTIFASIRSNTDLTRLLDLPMPSRFGLALGTQIPLGDAGSSFVGSGLNLRITAEFSGEVRVFPDFDGLAYNRSYALELGLEKSSRLSSLIPSPQLYQAVQLRPVVRQDQDDQLSYSQDLMVNDGLLGNPLAYGGIIVSFGQSVPIFAVGGESSGYTVAFHLDLFGGTVLSPFKEELDQINARISELKAKMPDLETAAAAAVGSPGGGVDRVSLAATEADLQAALTEVETLPAEMRSHFSKNIIKTHIKAVVQEMNSSGGTSFKTISWDSRLENDITFQAALVQKLQEDLVRVQQQLASSKDPATLLQEAGDALAGQEVRKGVLEETAASSEALFDLTYAFAKTYLWAYVEKTLSDDLNGLPGPVDNGLAAVMATANGAANIIPASFTYQQGVAQLAKAMDPVDTLWLTGSTALAGAVLIGLGAGYDPLKTNAVTGAGIILLGNGLSGSKHGLFPGDAKKDKLKRFLFGTGVVLASGIAGGYLASEDSTDRLGIPTLNLSAGLLFADLSDYLME